ncbi:hypothetical protein [Xenorhabdus cabanillasii]|uniref:Uncharacterized protein n=1 Tax=Xenorhabdus cabanillasii JM26 TaxID=1427517 RepID=W1IRE9_9GAMM|nr:hypothetical protein [Xenorhabdus cabanillasii]PHM76036.1 hypothetical protein Xcab_03418 [Xenorhabdus cabanillasii JM26]CDL80216.1 hypothetical protein XCR1_1410041 [Xenorhabdus cabanillasii JM26]
MAVKIEILITSESGELRHELQAGAAVSGEFTHQEYRAAERLYSAIGELLRKHSGGSLVIHQAAQHHLH